MLLSGIWRITLLSLTYHAMSDQIALRKDTNTTDLFDHGLRQNVNLTLLERGYGVVDELFAERGQHRWEGFDEGDADFASKFWIPGFEVILQCQCKCTKTTVYDEITSRKSCSSPLGW